MHPKAVTSFMSNPAKTFFEKKRATRNEKFSFWKTLLATVIFKLDLGDGSISWPQAHRLDQSPSQLPAYLNYQEKFSLVKNV